mgnify:CR=1 FL=1
MSDLVVDVQDLSRSFGQKLALDNFSIQIPKGCVYGLVGENGAGKTTLLKHLLGLYSAQKGSVSVFGLDPAAEPVAVLSRVGYLSEDREMPTWMKVRRNCANTSPISWHRGCYCRAAGSSAMRVAIAGIWRV